MPGPVQYTKSGKVKQAAPRKYESGKGWSKLTPAQRAAPSVGPTKRSSRKRQLRKAVSRGDFGRSFESTPTRRVSAPDTREQNREALGPVGDALATVAKALQEPVDLPGTKLDRIGEILSILVAPRGVTRLRYPATVARQRAKGQKGPMRRKRELVRGIKRPKRTRSTYRRQRTYRDNNTRRALRRELPGKRGSRAEYANSLIGDPVVGNIRRGRWWRAKHLTKGQRSLARAKARFSDDNRTYPAPDGQGYVRPPNQRTMK